MTPPTRIVGLVPIVASVLALALPGAAGAIKAGDATFQQTFPLASSLCAKLAAGTENKHLAKFVPQVTEDCTTLQSAFTNAQTSVLAARTAIQPTLIADRAALHAACPTPRDAALACRNARHVNRITTHSLALQLHAAAHAYFATIEGARKVFWTAIKSLPGEHHATADKPIVIPPAH
ncbi:MAG TPA: hypothetical protein VHT27_06690 [Solirubrobacteraceae bacterium]|jgi:hypothetical protein|nr:hypothetical protein [Solirubrobacteraceae bacterium]